jgi:hypothetical protein
MTENWRESANLEEPILAAWSVEVESNGYRPVFCRQNSSFFPVFDVPTRGPDPQGSPPLAGAEWDPFEPKWFSFHFSSVMPIEHQPKRAVSQAAEPTVRSDENGLSQGPLTDLDKWVSAERLLELVWDEESRPSLQWLRKETRRRMLPCLRRGHLIFYRPRSVLAWFVQKETLPSSMRADFTVSVVARSQPDDPSRYPNCYAPLPPDGQTCPITGLFSSELIQLCSKNRNEIRFVRFDVTGASTPKTIFHCGDVLHLLDDIAHTQHTSESPSQNRSCMAAPGATNSG